jgi:uncharacterized protein
MQPGIKAKNPHKHAAHCMRLLRMGYELVTTGEMHVDRTGIDSDELRAIRSGERAVDDVLAEAESLLQKIDSAVDTSPLPQEPATKLVENTLKEIIWAYLLGEKVNEKGVF